MSAPQRPSRVPGRRASDVGPDLRVCDAERAAVTDRLSQHYGDGRLDRAEFDERIDQAMSAKTQSELSGLLDDLPGGGSAEPPSRRQPRRPRHRFLFLVLVFLLAAAAGDALAHSFFLLLLAGLLAVGWLRYGPRRQHSRW